MIPKFFRQKIAYKANLLQKKYVEECWKKFLAAYFLHDPMLERFTLQPKKILNTQKIIWQYWGQGVGDNSLPEVIKLYFKSIDTYKQDYLVIRLDDEKIKEYLDLPDFVWEKRANSEFKHAFFADLIRLALLDVYGGIWLDATIMLTAPIPANLADLDFFMYQHSDGAKDKKFWKKFNADYFGWESEQNVRVLNSIIFSKKNNIVIHTCTDLLLNFWKTQNHIPHYFFFQIMFNELMSSYLSNEQCPIIDDTLPHILQTKLHKPFSQLEWDEITSKTNIHKMTYPKVCKLGSFYEYIKRLS